MSRPGASPRPLGRGGLTVMALLGAAVPAAWPPAEAAPLSLLLSPGQGPAPAPQPAGGTLSETLVFEDIPIVITASRREQKASEAPGSVAIITAEEIERHGFRTLGDALQSLPGIYVNYDHNYTYIGVRGLARTRDYNSRIQVQINGHSMNDNVFDYVGVGEDLGIEMSMVDRIEVVYGPGSALYGSNAVLATINVITRHPESVTGTQLALEGGSFYRGKAQASHGRAAGAWRLAGSAGLVNVNGDDLYFPEYEALGQNGGVAEGTDFERASQFYGRAENGAYSIQAFSSYRVKGIPTGAAFTLFDDDASRTTDVRSFVELGYRRPLREGVQLTLRGSYDEYHYWGTYRYDAGGGLLIDNIDRSNGRWISQEAQLDYRLSPRHHLTFGQGFVRNFQAEVENFDEDPFAQYLDFGRAFNEYSAYAQHEYTPSGRWHLTTGVRYDDYSTFGSAASPRFALVYAPAPTWRVKLLAGRAFKAPNIYELYYEALGEPPALSLDPEVVASYEAVFESSLNPRLDLRVALYQDRIRDLISPVEIMPGVNQFSNIDRALTRGGEIWLRARLTDGTSGYLSYSYMKAEDGDGQRLTNYPAASYKAGVSAPFGRDRWCASADLVYYEERLTLSGTQSPDVFLANAILMAPLLHRNARLYFGVYNLLDRDNRLPAAERHQDLVLVPLDRRTFTLRALWKF